MAEELQSLLEKINEEGVKKADKAKDEIIAKAKKEAADIVAKAKSKSEDIIKKSEEDAKSNETRAANSIRQASRDILLSMKEELNNRLESVIKKCVGESMTPEFMGKIILEMEKSFLSKGIDADNGMEILLSKKDLDSMQTLFQGSLGKDFKTTPEISLGHDFTAGVKVGFKGNDLFFDFSDDALSEIICAYVGPRLANIING